MAIESSFYSIFLISSYHYLIANKVANMLIDENNNRQVARRNVPTCFVNLENRFSQQAKPIKIKSANQSMFKVIIIYLKI